MSRKFQWELNRSKTAWYYANKGYSWGSVAVLRSNVFAVFVRQELYEPAKWVAELDDLDEAKALVQTLVGAQHV